MRKRILAIIAALLVTAASCSRRDAVPKRTNYDLKTVHLHVVYFCGQCHAAPEPDTFPRYQWPKEVKQGFGFYEQSGKTASVVPSVDEVVWYYQSLAPKELQLSQPPVDKNPGRVQFERAMIAVDDHVDFPAVSNIHWMAPADGKPGSLLFCDMGSGDVERVTFHGRHSSREALTRIPNPAHVLPSDLDRDGHSDLLLANLGSFFPADHHKGSVVWARWNPSADRYHRITVADKLGRVADVEPADFDGDGDTDLVVAEFGWRTTGHILLLEQLPTTAPEQPRFKKHILDERHGTIHVPVNDLNGDGRPDFVALISQEHETVVAFLNRGRGHFEKKTIFAANNPSFGSSGIQLVDFDRDGDLDVLYTNGDNLDSGILKPYHAVRWLENQGSYPFVPHLLAKMPGAYRAVAGDFDGDGDLDVVACAMFGRPEKTISKLIWLEQQSPNKVVRHDLRSYDSAAVLDIGDFDGDGRLDIAVAHTYANPNPDRNWLTILWNLGTQSSANNH